ncbi:hypothetical protein L917_00203 [Phytophthora nicotianae]|uniref:Transmembrane protein n=1 Tax=Phytophthora nicotianae TaxID=4792 RepID=W2HPW9_PHYNI|nr:hypothetical protein L915_00219 [Phytophthora nicotianae]ETL50558.1 hypothetical protein L916_00221 [Phytophthora nicotianae]ETM03599.1 hypothetical protein L917_00203 [Phytophthora nicotianae]
MFSPTSSSSSDQYEVMSTLRSEIFDKNRDATGPNQFDGPRNGGRRWIIQALTGQLFAGWISRRRRGTSSLSIARKGKQRAAVGGLVGASAMAGVWKMAKLARAMGVMGMIVGGVVGAGVSMRTSGDMVTDMLKLPSDKSPHAAQARDMYVANLSVSMLSVAVISFSICTHFDTGAIARTLKLQLQLDHHEVADAATPA